MKRDDISEYTDHPIFLHILNRELHDAIGKSVNIDEILAAIRIFSIVSSQTIFCNASQIHEVLYDRSDVLEELIELSGIGRFVDHSDYGSYEEFRESRIEKFSHSLHLHPGFFQEPKPELKKLPHGSMGAAISTTEHIQDNLSSWLEGDTRSVLFKTLTQNDARVLKTKEDWVYRTLTERNQRALTYDVFEQHSVGKIEKKEEGAIRRSLTELYIDSYISSFNARCPWGFQGRNHFERPVFLAGLHLQFATMVLEQVGIMDNLKKTANFGRVKRITSDSEDAMAFFRENYARFAAIVDSGVTDPSSRHSFQNAIIAAIQKTRSSGIIRPQREASSYRDILFRAGEALNHAVTGQGILRFPQAQRVYPYGESEALIVLPKIRDCNADENSNVLPLSATQRNKPWWQSHAILVVLGGILMGFATFLCLPAFFNLQTSLRIAVSIFAAMTSGCVIFWYHPDFYYRRLVFIGLAIAAVGGFSYTFKLDGFIHRISGNIEIGNVPSQLMIIGGFTFSIVSLVADVLSRKNKK